MGSLPVWEASCGSGSRPGRRARLSEIFYRDVCVWTVSTAASVILRRPLSSASLASLPHSSACPALSSEPPSRRTLISPLFSPPP